uniref:Uncharacterized protein n=1 Tax=Pithovirus LCPAC403 TaxID=2506596 RepID=A0A481ZFK1_9VIRU|nr:MAG: uncharacterized protein LCPAC403_03850 [Pithovirus LCPAC403]
MMLAQNDLIMIILSAHPNRMISIIALLGNREARTEFIEHIDCKLTKLSPGIKRVEYHIGTLPILLYDINDNLGGPYLDSCNGILHFCTGGVKFRTWKVLPIIHCYEEKNVEKVVMEMVNIIDDIHRHHNFTICLIGNTEYIHDTLHGYDNPPKKISDNVYRVDVESIFRCSVIIYGLYFPKGKYLDNCDGIVHFCTKRGKRYRSLVPVVYHSRNEFDPIERLILTILGY